MSFEHVFLEQKVALDKSLLGENYTLPLPRLSKPPSNSLEKEKYEVIVVGAGPAGVYGLKDSCLCIDADPVAHVGRSDSIMQRTLEILQSLGLAEELIVQAKENAVMARWISDEKEPEKGIKRQFHWRIEMAKSRFPPTLTVSQGRHQRILESDMKRHGARPIVRDCRLVNVKIDESDVEFPVEALIEQGGKSRTVRAKYLVGADGARSKVRESLGVKMLGSMKNEIWGVLDAVVDTDFPDIRRDCSIMSSDRVMMLVPREKLATGDYLTRLYVPLVSDVTAPEICNEEDPGLKARMIAEQKAFKASITPASILERATELFKPYTIRLKYPNLVHWWAAYQIGQQHAERMMECDSKGQGRIFLVGDASHTHSPSVGQGMNVSTADAYDLAWKLAYAVLGLTPNASKFFEMFADDRLENARNLIDSDRWYYGNRNRDDNKVIKSLEDWMPPKDFINFLSGITVEYDEGYLVDKKCASEDGLLYGTSYDNGVLREGRSIRDATVERFADGSYRHLQDSLISNGRFRILVGTSTDLLDKNGVSATALEQICDHIMPKFVNGCIELIALTPLKEWTFEWADLPLCLKREAEMEFYHALDAYSTYGIDQAKGIICVIRPDGHIGTIAALENVEKVQEYLEKCIALKDTRLEPTPIFNGHTGNRLVLPNIDIDPNDYTPDDFIERSLQLPADQTDLTCQFYDEWAHRYDKDAFSPEVEYIGPEILAQTCAEFVDMSKAVVFEAGCGTGLAAAALVKRGAVTIDGADLSTGMLREAATTKIYRRLYQSGFRSQLALPAHSYDVVFCVGALGLGHIGPEALVEFVRLTKPGGKLVVNIDVPSWEPCGFDAEFDRLIKNGVFKILSDVMSVETEVLGTASRNFVLEVC